MSMTKKQLFLIIGVLVAVLAYGSSGFPGVYYVPGSTQKMCQLTGDFDKDVRFNKPTNNQTNVRYGVKGTDVGVSFEHTLQDGTKRLYFLFGDTDSDKPGLTDGWHDCIAYTTEMTAPSDCIDLTFIAKNGVFIPLVVPNASLGPRGAPDAGLSHNGWMYIYFTTDLTLTSVLAKCQDDNLNFQNVYELSTNKFINVSVEVVEQGTDYNGFRQWLPSDLQNKPVLLIWGTSKDYRKSGVYLACQPLTDIENKSTIRYYKGPGQGWSQNESDAQPLFKQTAYYYDQYGNKTGEGPGVGELSVAWNAFLNKWIMLYNFGNPSRGINFRVADYPWGPWSGKEINNDILFRPGRDYGYCYSMHKKDCPVAGSGCDQNYDAWRDGGCGWGGEYGPYMINRYTEGGVQDQEKWTTIYFTMSTWNPYQKVLMKTTLSTSLPGDVYPKDTLTAPCGDGVIDIYDILAGVDFILNIQTPTDCQAAKGDVPNGIPPYCGNPPGTPNCEADGDIDIFDVLVWIDAALGKPNCIAYCVEHP